MLIDDQAIVNYRYYLAVGISCGGVFLKRRIMVFKHLGRFAILAVCLFAIVIVMVGCNGGNGPPPPPIVQPTETPMEKLEGRYELTEFRIPDQGVVLRPPGFTGTLGLLSYSDGSDAWHLIYESDDDDLRPFAQAVSSFGSTWSATETTLTLNATAAPTAHFSYSLVGERLTITYRDGTIATWEKK